MKRLSLQQVLRLHTILINETGGSDGLRDERLLDSALNGPFKALRVKFCTKRFHPKPLVWAFH